MVPTSAQKLAALYNNAQQVGKGVLHERGREQMTEEQAQELLDSSGATYFDYCHGREMKVDVDSHREDGRLYDRAYGEGAYGLIMLNLMTGGEVTDIILKRK